MMNPIEELFAPNEFDEFMHSDANGIALLANPYHEPAGSSKGGEFASAQSALTEAEKQKVLDYQEHTWNDGSLTRMARRTLPGGDLEKFHPGAMTLYRGVETGSRGINQPGSWSKSKRAAGKHGEYVIEMHITKNTPALDINRITGPTRFSGEKEVFIIPDGLLKPLANPYHEPAGSPKGGEFASAKAARIARAKESHKPSTSNKQQISLESERIVASAINGEGTPDNDPMDVVLHDKGRLHGVEVKTLIDNKNDKVTMHPESLLRKVSWIKKHRAIGHTVIVDTRQAKRVYYYRSGFGSFRLSSMKKLALGDLKRVITG